MMNGEHHKLWLLKTSNITTINLDRRTDNVRANGVSLGMADADNRAAPVAPTIATGRNLGFYSDLSGARIHNAKLHFVSILGIKADPETSLIEFAGSRFHYKPI